MATHIHCGGDNCDLQIHGFQIQHECVEIIGKTLHHIGDHHRLHTHGHGTFGEILAIRQRHDISAANLMDPLLELLGRADSLHKTVLLVQSNRAHRNDMIV